MTSTKLPSQASPPPARHLTNAIIPPVDRLLILQVLPRAPFLRFLTIACLMVLPFAAALVQFLVSAPPASLELWPVGTVQGITLSLLLGLYGIWRALASMCPYLDRAIRGERDRADLARLVEYFYGPQLGQLAWAAGCCLSSVALIIASAPHDIDVGMTVAIGELTFVAPNSLYWALRLAQFTRIVARSRIRFGGRDPRELYAIAGLGYIVIGAVMLVALEMALTGVTIWLLAQRAPGPSSYSGRWIFVVALQAAVLIAMIVVTIDFGHALVKLRQLVRDARASKIQRKHDELDAVDDSGLSRSERRRRRGELEKELEKLRNPLRRLTAIWFQIGLVALTVPFGVLIGILLQITLAGMGLTAT